MRDTTPTRRSGVHLGASLGTLAYTIVGIWGITTAATLVLASLCRRPGTPARWLTIGAPACVSVSVLAVVFTGAAIAAGYDPTGSCGDG